MNASSYIYMLPYWKELFVAFTMATNKKSTHYISEVTDAYIYATHVY